MLQPDENAVKLAFSLNIYCTTPLNGSSAVAVIVILPSLSLYDGLKLTTGGVLSTLTVTLHSPEFPALSYTKNVSFNLSLV